MRTRVLVLVGLFAASPAAAHRLNQSFVDLLPNAGGAEVLLDFDTADLDDSLLDRLDRDSSGQVEGAELEPQQVILLALARAGIDVRRGEKRCAAEATLDRARAPGMVRARLHLTCPTAGALSFSLPLAARMRPGHRCFFIARLPRGVEAVVLDAHAPAWAEQPSPSFGAAVYALGGVLVLAVVVAALLIRRRRSPPTTGGALDAPPRSAPGR
jgi:MYXO-CTERM domain-containing protein